jgi:hypothetical protein
MPARRVSEIELCFDSMTDLITNLAGGLVLLVLLLMGMTTEGGGRADVAAAPPPPAAGAGQKSIKPLEQQAQVLRTEIAIMDKNISSLESRLPALQAEIEALLKRAKRSAAPAPGKQ